MTKITKKAFIEAMTKNTTTLEICTRWRPGLTLDKVKTALDSVEVLRGKKRKITAQRSNHIVFSGDGSAMYFDRAGKNEYYAMRNKHGLQFYIAVNTVYDEWEEVNKMQYLIYGIAIADVDTEYIKRSWNSFDISGADRAENFRKILLQNGYTFDTGAAENYKHFSVWCSEKEVEMLLAVA